MSRVKEEFLVALIFVGKWLGLGFGAIAVLYFGISLAYHKTYLNPRIASIDLEVSKLVEQTQLAETHAQDSRKKLVAIEKTIRRIERKKLPKAEKAVDKASQKLESCEQTFWDKIPIPGRTKSECLANADAQLLEAKENMQIILDSLQSYRDEQSGNQETISERLAEIEKYEKEIHDLESKKIEIRNDVKAPLLWAAALLGLT